MFDITCPSCGTANPAVNRFCGACGARLDGSAAAPPVHIEERKVVTMLFADLTASTELAARLDPEDLRGVLRPFFDAMVVEIDRYGGTVEKYIGDAIVAAFGAPVAHEDDPERAIRCALAMHRRLAELNGELAERAGGDLAMRIGVNTGEVIAHAIEEGIVTGEAVNVAARFQALAEPGRVLVGERTYRDARQAFSFTDLGEVGVKGIDRPLRVWRVEGETLEPRAPTAALQAPFVGRGAELEQLRRRFELTVRERAPTLVTLVGPPGIGKSRLAQEGVAAFGAQAARVVRGRCLSYGDGLTYWPLAEILKADAGILDSDPQDSILEKARSHLDPRFPGEEGMGVTSVLLSSIGVEVPSDPLAGTEREAAKRVIARAWQRYLESMTAEGPVVVVIEDLHWADPNLLELIESVVARASGPALVLCTARPELFERRPGWGGGLASPTTIALPVLSAAEGAALIEQLLVGGAPAEVVGPVLRRSEGNPFFAGELLRMMIEDGTLTRSDDGRWSLVREIPTTLPDTVQGVIASRIDLLPPQEKRAIQDASVIGRVFWEGALARLETPRARSALDALVAKGLVLERDSSAIEGERELAFNHILTRDVAYASIPRARRGPAHATVGVWVEELTQGRAEEFSEILAHHFSAAGDAARTARYAMLAGHRQLRVFDADGAIGWLDRAMESAGSSGPSMRAEIALARGAAYEQLGRFEQAKADYDRALAEARDASDDGREARALAAIAHVLWLLDRYDEGLELLPVALERARAVGLADVEARLLYTAGTYRFGRGEFEQALPLHEQALAVAEASGDLEGQALAHHGLCETYFFQGPFEEGLAHGMRADRMLRDLGQRSMVAHNAYMVAWLLGFDGRGEEGLEMVEASIATSREIGNRREEGFALFDRAELHLTLGRIGDALEDAESGTRIFRELGLVRGEIVGLNVACDVLAEPWAFDLLRERSAEATESCSTLGGGFQRSLVLAFAAWSDLIDGNRQRAERWFRQARKIDSAILDVAWAARIEVLAWEWAADADGLASVGARIEDRVRGANAFWGGWGPYALGLAALLSGDPAGAEPHARAAFDAARGSGERRLAWRAARVAAEATSAVGRPADAEMFRNEAVALLEAQVAATPTGLRERFVARPDVAALLG